MYELGGSRSRQYSSMIFLILMTCLPYSLLASYEKSNFNDFNEFMYL